MQNEPVIYTDGHGIKVTSSSLIIGKAQYLINGITNVSLFIIKAPIAPGIILLLIGAGAAIAGFMNIFPDRVSTSGTYQLTSNQIAIAAGGILFLIGVIWLLFSKEKYTVRITTAEGIKDAVTSTKKEYIRQIVDAISEARYTPM
ncbi:MAG: hypothetical protein H0W62_05185 [Chitinophagales bacterium]|nr:hypothetical protein [Chitinophagales bacterium]